jgi:hypothetical protein
MKQATSALISYLANNNNAVVTDLYTFALVNGQIIRVMDYPLANLVVPSANLPGSPLNSGGGNITFTRGPKFGRSKVSTKIGIEPSDLEVNIYAGSTDLIGDLSWQALTVVGGFDGCTVELDRFFFPIGGDGINGSLNVSLGGIVWFYGKVSDSEVSRSLVTFKVKSLLLLLQQQTMPRRLFQTGCTHIFGDTMCGYNRFDGKNALGASTGVGHVDITALASSSQTDIVCASVGGSANYTLGSCTGLSGQNAGITAGIVSFAISTVVGLSKPFPYPVQIGDTFRLLPGCDHTSSTCMNVFNNLLRYGGFDYIPPPELSV